MDEVKGVAPIVVGVDGSDAADRALRLAADEARLRGLPIVVVTCWSFPALVAPTPFQPALSVEMLRDDAAHVLKSAVERVLGHEADTLDWDGKVLEGPASLRLVEESSGAAAVFVGSRGRGGVRGLLLGSVSQHLAEHARCPVVVVR